MTLNCNFFSSLTFWTPSQLLRDLCTRQHRVHRTGFVCQPKGRCFKIKETEKRKLLHVTEGMLEHTDLQDARTCYSSCSSGSSRRLRVCAGGPQHMPHSLVLSQKKLQIILNSLPTCLPHPSRCPPLPPLLLLLPLAADKMAPSLCRFITAGAGRNLLLGKSNTSVRLTLRAHQSEEPVIFLHPRRLVHIHLPQRQVKCGSVNKLAALRWCVSEGHAGRACVPELMRGYDVDCIVHRVALRPRGVRLLNGGLKIKRFLNVTGGREKERR